MLKFERKKAHQTYIMEKKELKYYLTVKVLYILYFL